MTCRFPLLAALLLTVSATAPARADTLELACNTTTKLGTEALKYSRINHGPAGWTSFTRSRTASAAIAPSNTE